MSKEEILEMNRQDQEAINLVHGNQIRRQMADAYAAETEEEEEYRCRRELFHGIGVGAVRVLIGTIFAGAIVEGLMDPLFGGICMAGCFTWAAAGFWKGLRNA